MSHVLKVILSMLTLGILVVGCSTPVEVPEIGKPAPSFRLTDIDGQPVSLSDLRGKPVLINFWATWCYACGVEMPYIQEVYNEWSEHGLVVLAINIGESPSQVDRFILEHNLSFPVLLNPEGNVAKKYNIRAIPTTYFIDGDGIIKDIKIGAFNSAAEIEDILNSISL